MNPCEFFINPADYGLPTQEELVAHRIWDNHFHGFRAKNPIQQYERNSFFVEGMGIERSISQEIGGTLEAPFAPCQDWGTDGSPQPFNFAAYVKMLVAHYQDQISVSHPRQDPDQRAARAGA